MSKCEGNHHRCLHRRWAYLWQARQVTQPSLDSTYQLPMYKHSEIIIFLRFVHFSTFQFHPLVNNLHNLNFNRKLIEISKNNYNPQAFSCW